jgi:hypothetical protein
MSSPAAVDPVAQITSPAPEAKAKKPRVSRAKKDDSEKKTESKTVDKESKDKEPKDKKAAPKRKTAGEKHPPFEEIIRECISEAVGDVRDGVSRPAIKSKSMKPTLRPPCHLLTRSSPHFFAFYSLLSMSRIHRVSLWT